MTMLSKSLFTKKKIFRFLLAVYLIQIVLAVWSEFIPFKSKSFPEYNVQVRVYHGYGWTGVLLPIIGLPLQLFPMSGELIAERGGDVWSYMYDVYESDANIEEVKVYREYGKTVVDTPGGKAIFEVN